MIGHPFADFTFVVRMIRQFFQLRPAEFRFEYSEMLVMLFRFLAVQFPGHLFSPVQISASIDSARIRLSAARPYPDSSLQVL